MAFTAARAKKVVGVSLTPFFCSNCFLIFSRRFMTRVMSISYTVCTCALVRLDSTMRCAMTLRIADMV